jgi:pseudouridine synthase
VDKPPNEGERLAKFLARAGVASRRHAEDLIAAGAVTVNDQVIKEQGTRIDPAADVVRVNGQHVRPPSAQITVAIHKPGGYVATAHDPQGRPIVADLLPPELRNHRLVPVGRLDYDSEGLILLSNDGDLTLHVTHPRYGTEKEYHAQIEGHVEDDALQQLRRGVVLPDQEGHATAPATVWRLRHGPLAGTGPSGSAPLSGSAKPSGPPEGPMPVPAPPSGAPPGHEWIGVIIHEGRKRQVRLMFAAVGARVVRLVRVRIGQLFLADVVPRPGVYHILTPEEIGRVLGKQKRM